MRIVVVPEIKNSKPTGRYEVLILHQGDAIFDTLDTKEKADKKANELRKMLQCS